MLHSYKVQSTKHKKPQLQTETPITPPNTDQALYPSKKVYTSSTSPLSSKSIRQKTTLFKPFSFLHSSSQETLAHNQTVSKRHKRPHVHNDPLKPCHHKSCLYSKPDIRQKIKHSPNQTRSLIDTNTNQYSLHNSISNDSTKELLSQSNQAKQSLPSPGQLSSSPSNYSLANSQSNKKSSFDHQDQNPQSVSNLHFSSSSQHNPNDVFVLSSNQYTNPSIIDLESTTNIFPIIENLLHATLIQSNFIKLNQEENQFNSFNFHDRIYTTIVHLLSYLPINRRRFPILFHHNKVINIPEHERNKIASASNLLTLSQLMRPIESSETETKFSQTTTTLLHNYPKPNMVIVNNHQSSSPSDQSPSFNTSKQTQRKQQAQLASTSKTALQNHPSFQTPLQTTNPSNRNLIRTNVLPISSNEVSTISSDSDSSDSETSSLSTDSHHLCLSAVKSYISSQANQISSQTLDKLDQSNLQSINHIQLSKPNVGSSRSSLLSELPPSYHSDHQGQPSVDEYIENINQNDELDSGQTFG